MFTNLTSLAFFCGLGAFYAQQTDQHNLFLGFIAAVIGLLILNYRDEISYRDRRESEDSLYRYIDSAKDSLSDDITNVRDEVRSGK